MPMVTQYKAIFVKLQANSYCNSVIFLSLLAQFDDSEKFAALIIQMFDERFMTSKLARLYAELLTYKISGDFPASLPPMIQHHFLPKLATHLREHGRSFLPDSLMEQIEPSAKKIELGGVVDAIAQQALAHLLQIQIQVYTKSMQYLSLSATIGEGESTLTLLNENGLYQPLVNVEQLNENQKSALQSAPVLIFRSIPSLNTKESLIMEKIKQLTLEYTCHLRESFFTSKHLKYWDLFDITSKKARTPQEVVNSLYEKHGIMPYGNVPEHYAHLSRHEVLVMNRTPWWFWLAQAFIIVITFPVSVPVLMLFSWLLRGTANFMRTDGSIYVEQVLSLCRQVGVDGPDFSSEPTSSSFPTPTPIPVETTLNQGVTMHPARLSYLPLQVRGDVVPATDMSFELSIPIPAILPTLEEDVGGMANMTEAFTRVMVKKPTMFVETDVLRTKGKAVFTESPPLERISASLLQQRFKYAAAWTKPWQELDEFSSQINVFRHFTFVRRPKKTDKDPVNIVPPTGMKGRAYAFGLSLFHSDNKTLIKKAYQNRASGPTAHKIYQEALSTARNNQEYTDVIEALINYHFEGIRDLEEKADRHRPEDLLKLRQLGTDLLNGYIDQLPEDYPICSSTARTLQAYFDRVWEHLERHELEQAWRVFGKDEIFEKCKMKALINTNFVQQCLPHFVCMWNQLMGLFFLNGNCGVIGVPTENEGERLQYYMKKTLQGLQEHHLPEAIAFEQECVKPLQRMQTHVEELFRQVPREVARQNARLHFKDLAAWDLDERWASYRHERRGAFYPHAPVFTEQSRNIVRRVGACTVIDAPMIEESAQTSLTR